MLKLKKTIWLLALMILFVLLLGSVSALAVEEITVIAHPITKDLGLMWRHAADLYNEKFEGKYYASIISQAGMVEEETMRQFTSGKVAFDVLPIPCSLYSLQSPYLLPLDSFIAEHNYDISVFGNVINKHSYESKIYGLPWRAFFHVSMFRKDLFEEAGLAYPENVYEILPAARKLTKKDANGDIICYGYALPFGDRWHASKKFQQWMENVGGEILNKDNTAVSDWLTSDKAIELVTIWQTMNEEGLVPDPLSLGGREEYEFASLGRIAMMDNWNAYIGILEGPDSPTRGKWHYTSNILMNKQVGPNPPGNTLSGWGAGISKATKHPEAAFEFLKILVSKEAQIYYLLEYQNGPSRMDVFDDPRAQVALPLPKDVVKRGFAEATQWELAPIQEAEYIKYYIFEEGQKMFAGNISPKVMLQNIADRTNEALQ